MTTSLPDPVAALFERWFDADFYLTLHSDVKEAGVDPVEHFLSFGWHEGRAPNDWFKPDHYASYTYELDTETQNPFVHLLERAIAERTDPQVLYENIHKTQVPHRKRAAGGARDLAEMPLIVHRPSRETLEMVRVAFDTEFYLEQNPEVAETGIDPVVHFLTIGWLEGRDPTPKFSVRHYLRHNKDIRKAGANPFVHYLQRGHKEGWRSKASVKGAAILERFEQGGDMGAYVAEAMALDPMVGFPRVPRRHTIPTELNAGLLSAVRNLRAALTGQSYDYVVAVPHIRMSGAARVAAIFTRTLAQMVDPARILVLITDGSDTSYDHWFPDDVARFDCSSFQEDMSEDFRSRLLIDVLRGIGCQTLINVNSRLVWNTLQRFGRQMSQDMRLATYLFTWDETPEGLRGGYPIQWLRDTADFHHRIFTDTQALAQDVSDRMGYDSDIVHALYTPIEEPADPAAVPAPEAKPRFVWAGRFDRQKRVDLLVEIAHANPHIAFDVYGEAVIGDDEGLDAYHPPANIHALGTYEDLSEVLATPYHGFLYTAQWDGLPTVLLDMARTGLPVVAPRVGGIGELVTPETGWLIEAFEDVDGYSAALSEMLADPHAARARAARMADRVTEMFSAADYAVQIGKALDL